MTDESPKPPPSPPAQKVDGVLVFDPRGYVTTDLPDEPLIGAEIGGEEWTDSAAWAEAGTGP